MNLNKFLISKTRSSVLRNITYATINARRWKSHYNPEESKRILDTVNSCSDDDILKLNIPKRQSRKLLAWKLQNGAFETIDQIYKLQGFDPQVLRPIALDLSESDSDALKVTKNKKSNQMTIPVISEIKRKSIKSCVSLHLGISNVFWSRIEVNSDSPCLLTHWQQEEIIDKKLHLHEIIQKCIYLDHLIPKADCYVFENPKMAQPGAPGSPVQVNINVQKSQLIGILGFALAGRINNEDSQEKAATNKLFYLKQFLAPRLFKTLVGTERVSTEQVIMELLRTHYNEEDVLDEEIDKGADRLGFDGRGKVNVPMELRTMYNSAEKYQKEFLGQSLLIGLTFVRLCLLKCQQSLKIVSK